MLVETITALTVAAAIYWYINRHKPVKYMLRDLRYALDMQGAGVAGLLDDWINIWRNNIVLPETKDKIAVITGGARGIGKEVVRGLLKANMTVVMGVRNPESIHNLLDIKENNHKIRAFHLDLLSLKSVKEFAENVLKEYPKINLLVNNAGIMYADYGLTEDGIETHLAVNHLSHFYLIHNLLPALKRGSTEDPSRIINISSCAHFPGYIYFDDINMNNHFDTVAAYAQSKLAQLMITRYINKLMEEKEINVKCYSVHPGIVNTNLFERTFFAKIPWITNVFFKSPEKGAVTVLYGCFNQNILKKGGMYLSNCQEGISSRYSKDEGHQKKLFEISCDLVGIDVNMFGKD